MKKNNTLVVCGGTGAHVALALVRMHALGQPLGFFRDSDGEPFVFPTVYLVDQDSGDGKEEGTAWQRVRKAVRSHPGRYDWDKSTGRSSPPDLKKTVTPLPVGADGHWFAPPNSSIRNRFADSPYLDLLTSKSQQGIDFSRGMMGSPAVGSLLFRLKDMDTESVAGETNHDANYTEMLSQRGKVAVVGSAIGGTGASVGPTLAKRLVANHREVMAVMVMKWFQFAKEGLDKHRLEQAQRRERDMAQNGDSALAYYGLELASRVATVPVGVPDTAITDRCYTGNALQPSKESFVHAVAALCCLRHYLDPKPYARGIYQMGAEDPTRLGGGNGLPGGGSVQSLANQAKTLSLVLGVFAETLSSGGGRFQADTAIRETIRKHDVDPKGVGRELEKLVSDYNGHIEWMENVLKVEVRSPSPEIQKAFLREAESRKRLAKQPLALGETDDEERVALALMHWSAAWVREFSRGKRAGALVASTETQASGGYWPDLNDPESLNASVEKPGELVNVPDENIEATIRGFVREENVAENGWPHPIAAVDHFRYAIKNEYAVERRQLKMLLVGLVMGKLTLRDSPSLEEDPPLLSLERLVDTYRMDDLPGLACVQVVSQKRGVDVVLGFNSPHTLLCPAPIGDNKALENAWSELWKDLTHSERPNDWRTEPIDEWRPADVALRRIRAWIKLEKQQHSGAAPSWTQVFAEDPDPGPEIFTFGRGQKLEVYWDGNLASVALPTERSGCYWPDDNTRKIPESELMKRAPGLASWETSEGMRFERVEFTFPDREEPTRGFWREHLDDLKKQGFILDYGGKLNERRLAVQIAEREAAILENAVLLDRESMMVESCVPMKQDPIPGSRQRPGRIRYPDYPLRSEYFDLLKTDEGERVAEMLKKGERVHVEQPFIDEKPDGCTAMWNLQFAGRSDPLPMMLKIDEEPHEAHWMVWPYFRSRESPHWRAYYVYHNCTDTNLRLHALYLDPEDDCIRRRISPVERGAYPVGFQAGDQRRHTGGPPIAVVLEHAESGNEQGLYVLHLSIRGRLQKDVELGIDFGTSHTVAAVRYEGKKYPVELAPELGEVGQRFPLVLHVSEDWSHVIDENKGVEKRSIWMPTYSEETQADIDKGLLASELMTIAPREELRARNPLNWYPGHDYVIPSMDVQRKDIAAHILNDFKWNASDFLGQEPALREVYLGMTMELVMADLICGSFKYRVGTRHEG